MNTQTAVQAGKSPHPLVWVAATALIVFCGVGVGAVMGWIPISMGNPGEEAASGKLATPKSAAARVAAAPAKAPVAPLAVAACGTCGVVQSVQEVQSKGEGSGLGAAGGAVVGGVLGNQIGGGSGKTIMTVVGAVGGAVAGNEVEKRVKSTTSYDITVRFEDGTSRVINEPNAPSWRAGDKVKVVNGIIQSNA